MTEATIGQNNTQPGQARHVIWFCIKFKQTFEEQNILYQSNTLTTFNLLCSGGFLLVSYWCKIYFYPPVMLTNVELCWWSDSCWMKISFSNTIRLRQLWSGAGMFCWDTIMWSQGSILFSIKLKLMKSLTGKIWPQVILIHEYFCINLDKFLLITGI